MFPGLTSLLRINSEELSEKGSFVFLTDSKTDGSFLLHHFISMFLKGGGDGGVCLVSLSQTLLHYHTIQQKLGTNLVSAKDNGRLIFVDCLSLLQESICAGEQDEDISKKNPFQDFLSPDFTLKGLYLLIREKLQEMSSESKLLLIDDISILTTIGISQSKVVDFLHYCCGLSSTGNCKNTCFVTLMHCDCDVNDMEMTGLRNQACYYADLEIFARGLETGYSRDVHGEIIIKRRGKGTNYRDTAPTEVMQYKLTDKGVNFFAPGTSVGVL